MKSLLSASLFASLCAIHTLPAAGPLDEHPGRWLGDLATPDGPTLRLGAELYRRADGSPWASVASPDQGVIDIPVAAIEERGDTVDLKLSFAELSLTWAGDHFRGVWKQDGQPQPFVLRQVADFPMAARPQTPRAPFPYTDETLSIRTAGGITLGATLSIPDGVAQPDVVILIGGSGPGTRDANLLGHRSFAVLADHLARQGIAVLRYDKRGVGRSTGDYEGHVGADLIDDLDGVVRAMRARRGVGRLGLIGHSEGAYIAAASAARRPRDVDFVVSMAGVGLQGLDLMLLQDRVWAESHGASRAEADRAMAYVRRYYDTVLAHAEPAPRLAALKALYQGLSPDDQALIKKLDMNGGTLSLAWAEKPFLRASLQDDPRTAWRAVKCPALVLGAGLDHQVPAPPNVEGIAAALHAGGNRHVEQAILPGLNHLFQTAPTGREDEYGSIAETLAPVAMARIVRFVQGRP